MRKMFFEGSAIRYTIDGKTVSKKEFDTGWKTSPPDFEAGECCTVRADENDFSNENRGRGRYNPQLATKPNDPNAYFTSVNAVKNEASRRGLATET